MYYGELHKKLEAIFDETVDKPFLEVLQDIKNAATNPNDSIYNQAKDWASLGGWLIRTEDIQQLHFQLTGKEQSWDYISNWYIHQVGSLIKRKAKRYGIN